MIIVEIEKDVGQWQRTIVEAEALKRLLSVSQYVDVPWLNSESTSKAEEENQPAPPASCSDLRRPMDMFAATYEKFLKSLMEIKAIKEAQKFGTTSGKAPSSGLFMHLLSSPLLSCTSGQSTWASDRQPSQASGQLLLSPHSVAAAATNKNSTQQQMAAQTVRPSKFTATAGINRALPASTCRKHLYSLQRRDLSSLKAVLNRTSYGSSARKNTGKTWLKQPPPLLLAGFSSAADNYRARSKSRSSGARTSVSAEGAKHLKRRNGSGALTSSSAASGSLKLKKQRKAAAAAAGGLLSNIHMTTAAQEPLLGMGSFHQKDSSMVPGQHRLLLKHPNFLLTEASESIRDPAAHHLPTTQKQDHEVQQDNADSKSSRYLHSFALNETLHPEVPAGEYSQATLSAASHSSLLFTSQPQHLPGPSSIIPSRNSSHFGSFNPMHLQPLGGSFPYQTHGIMSMWPHMSIPDLNAAHVPLCFNQASMANPYPHNLPFSMDMAFGGSGMMSSFGMHPFSPQPLHFNPMVAASAAAFHDLSCATSAFGQSTRMLNGASNTTTLNPADLETMMASGMPPITPTTPATTPQMLLSKLALQAPYWVVMLDYVAGANTVQSKGLTYEAERMKAYRLPMTKSAVARYYGQTVHSSAELVALMRGGQLQEQTLIAGVSGPTVPRLPLPSVHMRPMQTRKELSVAAQYAADSCLNLLASTGPNVQWTCVMSYDRWGGWRTAGQRLSAERMLDMLLEGHIDEYTPVVCTEAHLPFGTWLPTALLLPLGALVHMQDGVGARYQALSLKQSRLISEDEGLAVQTP
ncbi:hypothetical protein CEUSTIGMA_g12324.t1 [Chlamydomonas eustigma]|uniref:Uncharacterized protein n=1 Tax=Chlamydomonas eustigma TaxID=1157962 RepID=A0A250XPH6_9CHLO|nr:hypothetical protein CEUSTIGMA_g12324.t1 [Chlamydomonas eustigma]|eukprot:GAX84903.1 hypothetical protein CEUSTIGMA_g12324.t1 [Chlamydomonas eustigma]